MRVCVDQSILFLDAKSSPSWRASFPTFLRLYPSRRELRTSAAYYSRSMRQPAGLCGLRAWMSPVMLRKRLRLKEQRWQLLLACSICCGQSARSSVFYWHTFLL
jgi:hypothetical protein